MADTADISQSFALQVLTPSKLVEDADVTLATFPGVEGEFGVLPGHMPFITNLQPGVISYEQGGMPRHIAVSSGVVEVIPERVIVLARTAEPGGDVDVDRATTAKNDCDSQLCLISHDNDDWTRLENKLKIATARIEASQGNRSSY